jgi:formylglycine-generating enzyme required for sulfatase activity
MSLSDQARKMLDDRNLYPVGGRRMTLREASQASGGLKSIASVCAATSPNIPVYYVSWDDAVAFCKKLEADRARATHRQTAF